MKGADTLEIFLDMAGASTVVSRRSTRMFVDEGMEKEVYEPPVRKTTTRFEEAMLEEIEGTNSTSSSASSESSMTSQADVETLATTLDRSELGVPGMDMDESDVLSRGSGELPAAASISKLLRPRQPQTPSEDSDGAQSEELSTNPCPANFGAVVPGVYRSSYPQAHNYDFLKGLGLKTIVTLVQKDFPPGYRGFINANGIKHHVFDMKGTKKESIPIKTMKSILRLVLDQQNYPLLIHCNHGKHRTGCVVAVVRKLMGWDLAMILDDYKSYAEPKVRECDIEYITTFDLSTISNLSVKESSWQLRAWIFFRTSIFTTFVLLLWLLSGKKIFSQPADIRGQAGT